MAPSIFEQPFVSGRMDTPIGPVPVVSHQLGPRDKAGALKVRLGMGRMHYTAYPGLYALGYPDAASPVLVTANYKLSFDYLRRELEDQDVWILALDTNGINVWCAAGKGSFGTDGLIQAIKNLDLKKLLIHRKLILPQLAAPGVASQQVRKATGFKVLYGPIRSSDLPAYLENGLKADSAMRRKEFPVSERLALTPMELIPGFKLTLPLAAFMLLLAGLLGGGPFLDEAYSAGLFAGLCLIWALISGTVLGPLLLPWLPGRAFSLKGLSIGLPASLLALWAWGPAPRNAAASLSLAGLLLLMLSLASFALMNFTGSSTYTSRSGVIKEMRFAIPGQALSAIIGLGLWSAAFLV